MLAAPMTRAYGELRVANNAFCSLTRRLVSSLRRCRHRRWSVNEVWQQDIGVYSVHFTDQGDEWCHHLTVALTGDSHMAARGTDGTSVLCYWRRDHMLGATTPRLSGVTLAV
jgi:hypothetical protein